MSDKKLQHWPDEVRLKMIEKSEFYSNDKIYQYGYYDGFQEAIRYFNELVPKFEDAVNELNEY